MSLQINPEPKNKNCEMQLLITWTDVKCVSPQIRQDWHWQLPWVLAWDGFNPCFRLWSARQVWMHCKLRGARKEKQLLLGKSDAQKGRVSLWIFIRSGRSTRRCGIKSTVQEFIRALFMCQLSGMKISNGVSFLFCVAFCTCRRFYVLHRGGCLRLLVKNPARPHHDVNDQLHATNRSHMLFTLIPAN